MASRKNGVIGNVDDDDDEDDDDSSSSFSLSSLLAMSGILVSCTSGAMLSPVQGTLQRRSILEFDNASETSHIKVLGLATASISPQHKLRHTRCPTTPSSTRLPGQQNKRVLTKT